MSAESREFRPASSKAGFLAGLDWDAVASARATLVYRVYVAEGEDGWYMLVCRFMEHEGLFLPECCYGPYSELQEVMDLVAWLARPSVFALPVPPMRLLSVLDSYVYAVGRPFDPDCFLQPSRGWRSFDVDASE